VKERRRHGETHGERGKSNERTGKGEEGALVGACYAG
jgi:hypothetical protein